MSESESDRVMDFDEGCEYAGRLIRARAEDHAARYGLSVDLALGFGVVWLARQLWPVDGPPEKEQQQLAPRLERMLAVMERVVPDDVRDKQEERRKS